MAPADADSDLPDADTIPDTAPDVAQDADTGLAPDAPDGDSNGEDATVSCPDVQLRVRPFGTMTWSTSDLTVAPHTSVEVDVGVAELPPTDFDVQWTVSSQPTPSETDFVNPGGATTNIYLGFVGEYQITLDVVDRRAGSTCTYSPQEATIEAKPSGRIYMELFWDTPNAAAHDHNQPSDLDLKFANQINSFEGPGTVTAFHPEPDWGVVGSPDDNPKLLLDGTDGNEPESITYPAPSGQDCPCGPAAFYFPGRDYGRVKASIRYYIDGELYYEQLDREMTAGQWWYINEFRWFDPDVRIDEVDQVSNDEPVRDLP